MNKLKVDKNEELEKVVVQPGDVVFVKSHKNHKPIIKVFHGVTII